MNRRIRFLLLLCLLAGNSRVLAGGPLVLEGPAGNTPVNYLNPTIVINVEGGDLGSMPNAKANELVTQAFALWNRVDSATVNLQLDRSRLDFDINYTNFQNYLPTLDTVNYNDKDNLNPLIYDSSGEIIDAYLGVGQSDNTIGFAASILNRGSSHFSEGYAVINGKNLKLSDAELKLLIAHEIGHFLGLDHSQVNIDNSETDYGFPQICRSHAEDQYPLMYPFICRRSESLHSDDISAISALYPSSDIFSHFGILQGFFLNTDGSAILGANIWVQNITDGNTYSIVSDYLLQGTGFYRLYLPPGNYTLHANSINPLFNGGSSIGPYAASINDVSFQSPHPINPVTYQGAGGNDAVITVSAGQTVTISFSNQGADTAPRDSDKASAARNANTSDSVKDIVFGASWAPAPLSIMILVLLSCRFNRRLTYRKENG